MAWFVASERGAARPLLPLELFRDDAFRRYAATLFLLQVATVGLITFAPLLLQRGFGLTPSTAGIVMLAFIGGWAAMVPVAGILHDRFGPRRPIAIGALVAMVSLAAWTWSLTELTVALQIPFMALTGVGIGLSILPANTAAVTAGDASRRAATVGLVQTMRQLGGCTSIAVLSVFFLAAPSSAPTSLVAMAQTGFLILLAVVAVNVAINIRNGRAAAAP
jgi:fucose permease